MTNIGTSGALGTRRTRLGRWSNPGQIYHVITTTRNRYPYFSDLIAARCVVTALIRLESVEHATTLAYVVMPDHLHWLFQLGKRASMSIVVGSAKSYSAKLLNERRSTRSNTWQRGFFDRAIRREDDLVSIARYIVANPLRAGLVSRIGDYAHWDSVWMA